MKVNDQFKQLDPSEVKHRVQCRSCLCCHLRFFESGAAKPISLRRGKATFVGRLKTSGII